MVEKCPLEKTMENNVPCGYCSLMFELQNRASNLRTEIANTELVLSIKEAEKLIAKARKQIEGSEASKALKEMESLSRKVNRSHMKCAGCGLCFGGKHLADNTTHVEGVGDICQWCSAELKRMGIKPWLERIHKGLEKGEAEPVLTANVYVGKEPVIS
jgi:hypothetical protein